jgi:hypothetical protein
MICWGLKALIVLSTQAWVHKNIYCDVAWQQKQSTRLGAYTYHNICMQQDLVHKSIRTLLWQQNHESCMHPVLVHKHVAMLLWQLYAPRLGA